MELNTQQQQKMIQENSDAGLGERTIDVELRQKRSQQLSSHTLEILQNKEGVPSAPVTPSPIRRMPGNGSFC